MGFRFRRSIRLFPGIRVNLSKSGTSLSVGRRGATLNFGKQGVHSTVGLPGTGLSYRSGNLASESERRSMAPPGFQPKQKISLVRWILLGFLGLTLVMGVISAFHQ